MKKKAALQKAGAKTNKKPATKKAAVIDNTEETTALSEETTAEQPEVEAATEEVVEAGGQATVKSKGRDNSTLTYAGEQFKKGPLVRRILTDHASANKGINYAKMKAAFPDELLKRFGVFQDEDKAREWKCGFQKISQLNFFYFSG